MQVERAEHGEERCSCRFTALWTEGPRRGCLEEVGLKVIRLVQETKLQDAVLTEFVEGLTDKFADHEMALVQFRVLLSN